MSGITSYALPSRVTSIGGISFSVSRTSCVSGSLSFFSVLLKLIEINYDNGYILSPAIAAGKKVGNAFSGVMLGDWNTGTADDISKQTGLYGFHEGAMSFAFREDGTAFIGKSGKGRILLDGNESTIKSEGYNLGHGVLIDLDDNIFEMTNGLGGILLDASGDLEIDFSDNKGTSLLYINTDSDEYYL